MTRWKAGAGFLTTALLLLGPTLTTAVSTAAADAAADTVTHTAADKFGDPLQPTDCPRILRLEVDSQSPRVISSATPKVTVTGRVTNTGDRRVDDVTVRVQRGEPVATEGQLRDLADLKTDSASSPFVDVADSLDRGDSRQFKITVPVRGNADQSLALAEPGVYPALVNVNGQQEYSGQARLACMSVPLPVLSVPGGKPAKPKASRPGLTFLWPIMDTQPRRQATPDDQVVLTDDELADSLAVGGRLFGLVNSVSAAATTNSTLLRSMCFAVDPDLLQTVDAMTNGYRVRVAGGRTVAGKGADVAADWLNRLRDLTRGQCVISVPFADADLVALSRAGAVDLTELALGSSTMVSEILKPVEPVKNLYWPAGGSLDQRTVVDLAASAPATVLADAGHLRDVKGKPPYDVTGLQTVHPVRALPIDPLLSRTLAPSAGGTMQSGLATLTFRTAFDTRGADQVIVAPPRRWTASATELGVYLDLAQRLFAGGYATPQSLMQVMSGASRGSIAGLSYTPQDNAQEVPRSVTTDVVRINKTKRDLLEAMHEDNTTRVDPNQLLLPMQYGLLRGVSAVWRGHREQATAWVEYIDQQVAALCGRVVVKDPGRPLALASGDSPIPVNVKNQLPVAVDVRIQLTATAGLRPAKFTDVHIPALSSRSKVIDAEVIRAGRFTVDASLATPGGTKLGSTARLELTSTTYGGITVAITGVAGGVLVLLVVIRIFRRVRGSRAGPEAKQDEVPVDA